MRILVLLLLASCASCKTKFDVSPEAYASGDFTLVGALSEGGCKSLPVQGVDVCRFKEKAQVETVWRLILPWGKQVEGGTITVYWKDKSFTYSVRGGVVEIPLRPIIGSYWGKNDSDVATALAEVRWRDSEGLLRTSRAEGMAVFVVLKRGYDPMPIDSGLSTWGTKCQVEYSTAGRSALHCK